MARSIRTLDIFLTTLVQKTGGALPSGFVVTLPKIQMPEQVALLAARTYARVGRAGSLFLLRRCAEAPEP